MANVKFRCDTYTGTSNGLISIALAGKDLVSGRFEKRGIPTVRSINRRSAKYTPQICGTCDL